MTTTTTTNHTHNVAAPSARTQAMVDGRHAESARPPPARHELVR